MNRSLLNVIIGAFGGSGAGIAVLRDKSVKEITLSDAAILLKSLLTKGIYHPRLWTSRCSGTTPFATSLDVLLTGKGVEVKYGIHPVPGRMPGHMNVLLAEADVPYEKLVEMEDVNNELESTDVVIIIGANDVVNPLAAEVDPASPIYGMPVIKAWDAKNVIVMKRSMAKGYAAIENDLFYHPKTRMLFGDGKVPCKA